MVVFHSYVTVYQRVSDVISFLEVKDSCFCLQDGEVSLEVKLFFLGFSATMALS